MSNNDLENYGIEYCTDKITTHGYHRFYNKELEEYRRLKNIGILEIGIQHNNSLNLWKKFFPNAFVYGIDINIDYSDERCKIFKVDQSSLIQIQNVKSQINNPIYFINDDGSHVPEHQILCFDYFFSEILKEGGVYIIEDIETSYWKKGQVYGYPTNYGFQNYFSIIEKFKLLVDYVNFNFLSEKDRKILDEKTNFISQKTKKSILSINFSENCIIIKKKNENDYNYHNPYYFESFTN